MNKPKVYRPRNWLFEVLVVAEGVALVLLWSLILGSWKAGVFAGACTYLLLANLLRRSFQKHHRRGIAFFKSGRWSEAEKAFTESYEFFTAHPWIDKYPFISMLSSNAVPYRHMALNNMGICRLNRNEPEKALEAFELLRELNPDYPMLDKTISTIKEHLSA